MERVDGRTTIRAATADEAADLTVATIVAYFSGGAYTRAILLVFAATLLAICRLTLIRASILAGQIANETKRFKFGGQVKAEQYNWAGLGATDDGAAGLRLDGPEAAVKAVAAHHGGYIFGPASAWPVSWAELMPHAFRLRFVLAAGYGGTVTVLGDYGGGRWATDPDYAEKVAIHANALLALEAGMGHVPKPPITSHPITKTIGAGRDPDLQRKPGFTVLHSMGGTLKGTDSYFPLPTTKALTDFGIGQVDAGGGYAQIIQWNDPFGKQIGWASGPVSKPEGDGPRVLAMFGGAAGLNRYGVSIEHDDTTRANGTVGAVGAAAATAAQWSASCWLQAYIHAEWLGQTAATYDLNTWHLEFCGRAYKTCPNPRITDHVDEYQAAVRAIMRHWQEGADYPEGGVIVNGLRLAVPTNTAEPVVQRDPPAPAPPGGLRVVVPGTNEEFWIVQPILGYYEANGGVARFGWPQTGMYTETVGEAKGLAVQYFERARLEVQPDGSVTEGRLGSELLALRESAA